MATPAAAAVVVSNSAFPYVFAGFIHGCCRNLLFRRARHIKYAANAITRSPTEPATLIVITSVFVRPWCGAEIGAMEDVDEGAVVGVDLVWLGVSVDVGM